MLKLVDLTIYFQFCLHSTKRVKNSLELDILEKWDLIWSCHWSIFASVALKVASKVAQPLSASNTCYFSNKRVVARYKCWFWHHFICTTMWCNGHSSGLWRGRPGFKSQERQSFFQPFLAFVVFKVASKVANSASRYYFWPLQLLVDTLREHI